MQGFDFAGLLPLVLIFVVMYFLIIRPQNKKAKEHQNLIQNLKKGDRVVMNGGLIGIVAKVEDTELELTIAKDTAVRVSRPMVATVIPSGREIAKIDEASKAEKAEKKVEKSVEKKAIKKPAKK